MLKSCRITLKSKPNNHRTHKTISRINLIRPIIKLNLESFNTLIQRKIKIKVDIATNLTNISLIEEVVVDTITTTRIINQLY